MRMRIAPGPRQVDINRIPLADGAVLIVRHHSGLASPRLASPRPSAHSRALQVCAGTVTRAGQRGDPAGPALARPEARRVNAPAVLTLAVAVGLLPQSKRFHSGGDLTLRGRGRVLSSEVSTRAVPSATLVGPCMVRVPLPHGCERPPDCASGGTPRAMAPRVLREYARAGGRASASTQGVGFDHRYLPLCAACGLYHKVP